jgi:branched-chain amino acid transport system substrate-binding protein
MFKRCQSLGWGGVALAALAVAGLAGCGSSGGDASTSGDKSAGGTVTIYSSLPLQGASKTISGGIVNGMRLALDEAGGRAGATKVKYVSLDDSTAQAGTWDPSQVAQNARQAVQDRNAVAYLGELHSGASAVAIPITNQGGLAEISAGNTYVGLTTNEPGSASGEPTKYYPTGKRTFARIVPRDTIQGAALATLMQRDGCQRAAVANDRDTFGIGLAKIMALESKKVNLTIVSSEGIQKDAPNFRSYAAKLKALNADCFLFAGVDATGAASVLKDVGAALPSAKLYGPDGTCESGLTNPKDGGIPFTLGKRFTCTVATQDLASYPGGEQFLKAYKAKYGGAHPDPYSIYGYEAMSLVLATIKAGGTDRTSFLTHLFQTHDRHSVLGTYSLDANGDTSIADYGVYKVGPSGNPLFSTTIRARP